MFGKTLLGTCLTTIALLSTQLNAVPVQMYEPDIISNRTSDIEIAPEIINSGEPTGSGSTAELREGGVFEPPTHPDGCIDNAGVLHGTGSTWNVGCKETCECVYTPEGPIETCSPPRCAIPMLSPGCQIVPNPLRNESTGENCCDTVECKPIYCTDNLGGKHEVFTSWRLAELDCFCQYDHQSEKAQADCVIVQSESVETKPPILSELYLPDGNEVEREIPVNETKLTSEGCLDENQNKYSVGQTWRVGCESDCVCVQQGEITLAECSPIGCPVPQLLAGCRIIPNPKRELARGVNCCDVAECPHQLCIGTNQLLHPLYTVWYEEDMRCTCELNYNVNQAVKICQRKPIAQSIDQNINV